jgi:hypothetical protein
MPDILDVIPGFLTIGLIESVKLKQQATSQSKLFAFGK